MKRCVEEDGSEKKDPYAGIDVGYWLVFLLFQSAVLELQPVKAILGLNTGYMLFSAVIHCGLADSYMGENFDNHQDYIEEVMRANANGSCLCHTRGQLLIIPYEADIVGSTQIAAANE